MKLNHCSEPWPLQLESCPCDQHFVEYLDEKRPEGKMIFHFGTGEHHLVGKHNHQRGNPNEVLAITASTQEYQVYMDFIIDNPEAANYYKVMFGDIYTLSPRMMPSFDIVTLFHLCEYYDEQKSGYARLNDVKLLELFLLRLSPGGKIIFFTKSWANDLKGSKAAIIVKDFLYRKRMVIEDEVETLLICGRPW